MAKERWDLVDHLVTSVLAKDPSERPAFLGGIEEWDSGLRKEVESLVAAHENDQSSSEKPTRIAKSDDQVTLDKPPAIRPPSAEPKAADRIGPYRLLREIGEGGMGVVYEAEQEHPVRRKVALKLIKWGMDTKEVIARFESERQALALMNHPNIASVHDAGATAQGRPYFVMEYIHGIPITDYSDKHRMPIRERLELFINVCEGIQHAHQKGIIHRDIKPSNVLVTVQDDTPAPKIIDFGVAKATSQRLTEHTVATELGQLIGTPEYMSPEQAEMTNLDIDTRTDVYSLGVLLYELLAGTQPFDSKELRKAGLAEIQRKLREDEPPRPSTRVSSLGEVSNASASNRQVDVRTLERQLKGDLDWITMKALNKDRTRRYETANALALDIERYLNSEPVRARAPSPFYRAGKFVRRHRLGVAVGAGVVGLLIGVTILTLLQSARIARERDRADREAEVAGEVSDFLIGVFEVSDPSEARGNSVTAREILDTGATRIREELSDQPMVKARLLDTMGVVYKSLGLYEQGTELLEEGLALRRVAHGDNPLEVATSLQNIQSAYWHEGRLEEAASAAQEALSLREAELGPDHADVAQTLDGLSVIYGAQSRYSEAIELSERALAIREKELGGEHLDVAKSLNNLGGLHWFADEFDDAERCFERALEIYQSRFGESDMRVAVAAENLALLYWVREDFDEVERNFERSLSIKEGIFEPDHPQIAKTLSMLGVVNTELGKYTAAEEYFRRAMANQEKTLGPEHLDLADTLAGLAELHKARSEYDAAAPLLARAVEIREKAWGPDSPSIVEDLRNYAAVLREVGRTEEASALEDRADGIEATQN